MKRAALLLALSLAACEQQAAGPAEQGGAAAGEVLQGSISDAMIPLEQLDSEAPLAPRQAQAVDGDVDAEQPEVDPVAGIDSASVPSVEAGDDADPAPSANE